MKIAVAIVTAGVAAAAFGVIALLGAVAGEALGFGQAFGTTIAVLSTAAFGAGLRIAEHALKSRIEETHDDQDRTMG